MLLLRALALLMFCLSATGFGAEISLTSGLLKTEKVKQAGTKIGSMTTIQLGSRYADLLGDDVYWYGEAEIKLTSFDTPSGQPAPTDSTGMRLGGGLRYHFVNFSQSVVPYLLGGGAFVNSRESRLGTVDGSESNGLFYGASFGFRFNLGADFFAELETELFTSALFASEETTVGGVKTERTRFDLYADTSEAQTPVSVNLGIKF